MRCIEMTGSDNRMDCRATFDDPLNRLPAKCPACGFPDLDHVPQPYFLRRGPTKQSNELALAQNGNFFVRPRAHQVLELVTPRSCKFFPTHYKGTSEETPWLLAVPVEHLVSGTVKKSIRRCPDCGEPASSHPGSQWAERYSSVTGHEIAKDKTWASSEKSWTVWLDRALFFSVRLYILLKKLKIRGIVEVTCKGETRPDSEDMAWVQEKLSLLQQHGFPSEPPGSISAEDRKWFRGYLKANAKPNARKPDFKGMEKKIGEKLPKSYKEFMTKVGPLSFENVDDEEGLTVRLVPPNSIDAEFYRRGELEFEDEESRAVDGVQFAQNECGDVFCFDVKPGQDEYPVVQYLHEMNYYEAYADNFVACLRRFVGE
jgi:SMI1/KNR4 family protein SUKH-1